MSVVYWRDNCIECNQNMVYGWENNNVFRCCACHDSNDYTDTRLSIDEVNISSLNDAIIEELYYGCFSPKSIIDF